MSASMAEKASDEAAVRSLFRMNDDSASVSTSHCFFIESVDRFFMMDRVDDAHDRAAQGA